MDMKPNSKQQPKLLPEPKKTAWAQWAWVLVAIVIIGGGLYLLSHGKHNESVTGDQMGTSTVAIEGATPATHHYEWSFRITGGDAKTGADLSEVTLTTDGQTHVVGTYEGHCSVIGDAASSWPLATNELTGVICYWAGAGDEVGVFMENGAYSVQHGTVAEGSAEVGGSRGPYTTLFAL